MSKFHRKVLALLLLINFSFPVLNILYISISNYISPPEIHSKLLLDKKLASLRITPSKNMHGDYTTKQWAVVNELKDRLSKYLNNPALVHRLHTKDWQELAAQTRIIAVKEIDVQSYHSDQVDPEQVEHATEEIYKEFAQLQTSSNPKVWVSLGIVQLHSKHEEETVLEKMRTRAPTEDVADGRKYCKVELSPTCDAEYKIGYFGFVSGDQDLYNHIGQYVQKQIQAKEGTVIYGPQLIFYRDRCYILYPEMVCDLRYKDQLGCTMNHLRTLAKRKLANDRARQAAINAQRAMESNPAATAKYKQHTVAFTDNNYSCEFRAAVFGAKTGSCKYIFDKGKYLVFRVVRTYNSGAVGVSHQKVTSQLAQLITEALLTLKIDDTRYKD